MSEHSMLAIPCQQPLSVVFVETQWAESVWSTDVLQTHGSCYFNVAMETTIFSLYYPLDFCSLESLNNPWDEAIKNFFQQIRLPIVCENFVMWKKLCLWPRALTAPNKKRKNQKNGGQCSNYIPYSSCCMPNAEYLADTLILKQRIVPCEQLNGMSLWDP